MPAEYTLVLTEHFRKDLKKLSRQDQVRVRRALDELRANPYRGGKVSGVDVGCYRWRVGDFRIRYDIENKEVLVLRVIKREDVYRKF